MNDTAVASEPIESDLLTRRFPLYPDHFTFEPSNRWVRALVGDTTVVDSRSQILVWEPGHKVPEYGFPLDDVRVDLLEPGEPPSASYYRPQTTDVQWFDLVVGDRRIPAAAWKWNVDGLENYIALSWFPGVLDAWFEEDELVHTHPRDPASRIDVIPSSRHVVVSVGTRVLADSHNSAILYENGLPARYYLPEDDVELTALVPVNVTSSCPYKGHADRYWATREAPGREIAWSYSEPAHAVDAIRGRIAFYNDRVDLTVDGVPHVETRAVWAEAARRRNDRDASTSEAV